MAKYTFLLPAYKAAFLEEALESILNQIYTDFLVIVSDDCSPENLKTIFLESVGTDSRFIYRRNETNVGGKNLIAHWNMLIDMCKSPYLIMASDDDIYDKNFLQQIDALVTEYPDVDLYRARVRRIYQDGTPFGYDYLWEERVSSHRFTYDMYSTYYFHCIANYVFRTSAMKSHGGFVSFPLAWFSDDATVLRESRNGVCNTPDIVFSFRYSKLNLSDNFQETNDVIIQKYAACVAYHDWAKLYWDEFRATKALDEDIYYKVSQWGVRAKIQESINACLPRLTLRQFVDTYIWLSNNGYIEGIIRKIMIVRHWFHKC